MPDVRGYVHGAGIAAGSTAYDARSRAATPTGTNVFKRAAPAVRRLSTWSSIFTA